jgi:exonuclease VII small subunit
METVEELKEQLAQAHARIEQLENIHASQIVEATDTFIQKTICALKEIEVDLAAPSSENKSFENGVKASNFLMEFLMSKKQVLQNLDQTTPQPQQAKPAKKTFTLEDRVKNRKT